MRILLFKVSILHFIITFFIPTHFVFSDDLSPSTCHHTIKYKLLSHELSEKIATTQCTMRTHADVTHLGQHFLDIHEEFEDFHILQAYTLKTDGRKIPISKDKILISHVPGDLQETPFDPNIKRYVLVFPDVLVGDAVFFSTKIRDKKNPSPGGFSINLTKEDLSKNHTKVSLDIPEALKIHKDIQGFSETRVSQDGRILYTWTQNTPAHGKPSSTKDHTLNTDLHLLVSTYPDHESVEKAFFKHAVSKSIPTEIIRTHADRITEHVTDRRAQAETIYDWITKNIRYVMIDHRENMWGWIPHDAESILALKYGDCKDYTTLMRALLAAKGIDSEYVAINSGPTSYKRLPIPIDNYNHVILYLPEFDLYTDPTAQYPSFQYLPLTSYGKPVIHGSKERSILATIPAVKPEANRLSSRVELAFRPDGTPYGRLTFEATGPAAAYLREHVSNVSPENASTFVEQHLKEQYGWQGTGTMEPKDALDHKEPYTTQISFELKNNFFKKDSSSHDIAFTMMPLITSNWINDPRDESLLEKPTEDVACNAGTYTSIFNIKMPKGMSLKKLPPTRHIHTPLASYTARYSVKEQTVHIERYFVTKTLGPLCTPKMAKTLKKVIERLNEDTDTSLTFIKTRR